MFSPGPLKSSDAYRLDRMEQQLRGLLSPIICGPASMYRGADGRPIIFALPTAAASSFTICATSTARRTAVPTDTQCPPCDTVNYVKTFAGITALLLDPCGLRATPSSQCGGSAGGSSGSSATPTALLIETQGFTGTWPTPWDIVFCSDTCSIVVQWAYGCFYKGLFLGYWLGPPASCGSSSGGSGIVVGAAKPVRLIPLASRFSPPGSAVDPAALPAEVRATLPAEVPTRASLFGRVAGRLVGRLFAALLVPQRG